MRRCALFWVVALVFAQVASSEEPDGSSFRPLFNGRDLNGWVLVNTPPSTWTMQDDVLICSGRPTGEIRTERMYQNFVLELEWRHMRPKGNAGVFVWADDITARGVPFHRSIEVQVLENAFGNTRSHTTHGDIFPIHGATMTPINGRGGSRAFPTEERSKPSPQWNHYRVTCLDGEVSLAVNGKVVTQGKDCSPRKGYICLESEGGIVHYRNVRIQELDDSPVDPQHVAVANRGYRSLYTGLDLSGWRGEDGALASWRSRNWILSCDGESAASDPSISTTESFGNFGFVVDVRLKPDSETVWLKLRGSEPTQTLINPKNPSIAELLGETGQWNRLEGTLRDDRLTLAINGRKLFQEEPVAGLPDRGPITITPRGPVDLANLFVRALDD